MFHITHMQGTYREDRSWVTLVSLGRGAGYRFGWTLFFGRNTDGVAHEQSPKIWTCGITRHFNRLPIPKWFR